MVCVCRYILYIHLVINDILMLNFTVALQLIAYTVNITFAPCCFLLLLLVTTNKYQTGSFIHSIIWSRVQTKLGTFI